MRHKLLFYSPESMLTRLLEFWAATIRDPVATFTFFLVLATVGLWLSTVLLWLSTRRLAKDSKESAEVQANKMERSIAAAVESAAAATNQARIADDTARRQLRAYLSLRPVEMNELAINDESVRINFPVENTGSTPANNWTLHVAWRVTDEQPSSERFDEWLAPYANWRGEHSIGPNQRKNIPLEFDIPNALRQNVLAGVMHLYVLGDIVYQDAFETERKTEFFYAYNPKLPNRLGQVSHRNKIT